MSRYNKYDCEMAALSGEKLPENRELPEIWIDDDTELEGAYETSWLLKEQAI